MEVLEEGSVVEASDPEPAELTTEQTLAEVEGMWEQTDIQDMYLKCSSLFNQAI